MNGAGHVLVVSLEPLDAFTTLFFTNGFDQPHPIRIVQYGRGDMAALAGASAVVLIRGLFEFSDLIACARALGVPVFYFVDDNFMVLRDHPGPHAMFVERYSIDNVRQALQGFAGVLLSSAMLSAYFSDKKLHSRLFLFPPIGGRALTGHAPVRGSEVRIAFFGGQHLHEAFFGRVLPAIRRLSLELPVALTAVGVAEPILSSQGLCVNVQPYDVSYRRAVEALAARGVDLLVHPGVEGLENNWFKNPHALITANSVGAVPIVSNLPPYDGLESGGVALLCEDAEDSWYRALARAAHDDQCRSQLRLRLAAYCASHFDGCQNHRVLNEILAEHAPPDRRRRRWRRALAWGFLAKRMLNRVSSLARRGPAGLVLRAGVA